MTVMPKPLLLVGLCVVACGGNKSEPDRANDEPVVQIPAGIALVGCGSRANECSPETSRFRHLAFERLRTPAFEIDVYEVTIDHYRRCVEAGACQADADHRDEPPRHPALVTFSDAMSYCRWRGMRLPLEIEWEYAARGPSGLDYPWGQTRAAMGIFPVLREQHLEVGQQPLDVSPFGLHDMAGNAVEWVIDPYFPSKERYYRHEESRKKWMLYVAKGSDFYMGMKPLYSRDDKNAFSEDGLHVSKNGFRCASSATTELKP